MNKWQFKGLLDLKVTETVLFKIAVIPFINLLSCDWTELNSTSKILTLVLCFYFYTHICCASGYQGKEKPSDVYLEKQQRRCSWMISRTNDNRKSQTENTDMSIRKCDRYRLNSNGKYRPRVFDQGDLKESYSRRIQPATGNGHRNCKYLQYVSETTTDSIEISTTYLGFTSTTISNKVSTSDCDNDRCEMGT